MRKEERAEGERKKEKMRNDKPIVGTTMMDPTGPNRELD